MSERTHGACPDAVTSLWGRSVHPVGLLEHSCVFSCGRVVQDSGAAGTCRSVCHMRHWEGGCWGLWPGLRGRGAEHLCGRWLCGGS